MSVNFTAARRAAAVACALAVVAATTPAFADREDDRMMLFRHYLTLVATGACEIDVPQAQGKRFSQATEVLEQKVGATKEETDQAYKQIKDSAEKSPAGFCETYRSAALETLSTFE